MLDRVARQLFRLQQKKLLTPVAIGLYFYFCTGEENEKYNLRTITEATGYAERSIRYNLPVLQLCGLIEIGERTASRHGAFFSVVVRSASSPEVRKATSKRGGLPEIQKYRAWQYKQRNHFHKEKKKNAHRNP